MKDRQPDMQINVYFVEYGYQVDILDNQSDENNPDMGFLKSSFCRDFGGSHPIKKLKESLQEHVINMLDRFRKDK